MDDKIQKVQEIISKSEKELKSIEVSKDIDIELDVGNLLASDPNELSEAKLSSPTECDAYMKELARDAVQVLLNKVWDLPRETINSEVYAVLPTPQFRLPREKKAPKPKAPTRWEQFAKEKGLVSKKKEKKVWDETLKEWVPTFGLKKIQADRKKTWLIEVPGNADPMEDQFQKLNQNKKERKAKNEFQRLRNMAKSKNVKIPKVGVVEQSNPTRSELKKAITTSRLATASLGKFQPTLPNEKPIDVLRPGKRKRSDTACSSQGIATENASALKILSTIVKPKLNLEKAVGKQIAFENVEMSKKPKKGENTHRRSKMGGRSRGASEQKARTKGMLTSTGTKQKKHLPKKKSKFQGTVGSGISKKGYNSSMNKVLGIKGASKGDKRKSGASKAFSGSKGSSGGKGGKGSSSGKGGKGKRH